MGTLSPEAAYQLRRAERRLHDRESARKERLEAARRAAAVLREEFGATRVLLFGSLRRAWFREASDIDLACQGVALERLGVAWDRVTEVVGGKVDIVALEEADPTLRDRILATGEELT